MKSGWRWYGPDDAISLKEIRQAGVTDVVAALYRRKAGEIWPVEEIKAQADAVRAAGMEWTVVESVPVHEDIKKHAGNWKTYLENYKQTLRNLASCGIKTVCYNFMPILDWTRSNLNYVLPDGSDVLCYNQNEVTAFDLYALKENREFPPLCFLSLSFSYGQSRAKSTQFCIRSHGKHSNMPHRRHVLNRSHRQA